MQKTASLTGSEEKNMADNHIIGFYPYGNGTDQYMRIIDEESVKAGYPVIDLMTAMKRPSVYMGLKIVNLNWFESINASSDAKIFANYMKRLAMLSFFKATGKKIIFTYHNVHPHNMKDTKWSDKLTRRLCKWADKIVVLCDHSEVFLKQYCSEEELKKKMVTIPPATYKGCYCEKEIDFRAQWGIDKNACVMTYVGSVQPYKNIELIIEAAKRFPDIYFVIAGGTRDHQYRDELMAKAESVPNVIKMFQRIDDDELPALVKNSSYIITPYDRSSLNSGVAILAFSYGRTVICPIIGTLLQMGNLDHVFAYDYKDQDEHLAQLCDAIKRAYDVYTTDNNRYIATNAAVLDYIETKNSRDIVRQRYAMIYQQLCAEGGL